MSKPAAIALGVVVALTGSAIVAVAFLAKPEPRRRHPAHARDR
jgi:hypothetical protein